MAKRKCRRKSEKKKNIGDSTRETTTDRSMSSSSAVTKEAAETHERLIHEKHAVTQMHEIVDPRHGKIHVTNHVYMLIEKEKKEACPQRTPVWYQKRNNHVTASMMASACNANPYDSRSSALKKKTGASKPFTGNAATEHGNKYEFEAIEKYEGVTGQKCLEFGLLESLNPAEDFLAGKFL